MTNNTQRSESILSNLISVIPSITDHHHPSSDLYNLLKQVARKEVESSFANKEPVGVEFGPFGELVFPYFKMGNVDSLNLFDLDELIIFSFYWTNRNRYKKVLDIGANIGLHSVILSKCGYDVHTYEPDPTHFGVLQRNLEVNNCSGVEPHNEAVSNETGELEFVRVLGNTTGSHLAGSKQNPYGDLERFQVKTAAIEPLIAWADLMKLDVEGHEPTVILATKYEHWQKTDALVEIENKDNAAMVFDYLSGLGVNLFAQKTGWQQVKTLDDMPCSYHDGTLFITCKDSMPW